jgi:death on curing protein
MITVEEVLSIHSILVETFGGSDGVRDRGLLEAAIARPFQTFDSKELYDSPSAKAAAIVESIVKNHPFVDGNKRSGYTLMRLILLDNGFDILRTEDEKYDFIISIAEGKIDFDQILEWIEVKLRK